jgi:glycosyltransferase involved in cell wall biosynthesis
MNNRGHQPPELDIVIPVYNEGDNILPVLDSFKRHVKTPCRVLLCYDHEDDNTLPAVRAYAQDVSPCNWSKTGAGAPSGRC